MEELTLNPKLKKAYTDLFNISLSKYVESGQTTTTSSAYIEFQQQASNFLKVVFKVYPLRDSAVKEATNLVEEYKLRFKKCAKLDFDTRCNLAREVLAKEFNPDNINIKLNTSNNIIRFLKKNEEEEYEKYEDWLKAEVFDNFFKK